MGEELWPKGTSTIRLKGEKPRRLEPQAHTDLLSWGTSENRPLIPSQRAGGARRLASSGGPAPLDVPFSSSCFSRVHHGVCAKTTEPLAEPFEEPAGCRSPSSLLQATQ